MIRWLLRLVAVLFLLLIVGFWQLFFSSRPPLTIDPATLAAIYRAEKLVQNRLSPDTVRCRVRADTVVIELDTHSMAKLDNGKAETLRQHVATLMSTAGIEHPVSFQAYRMGSAFLRPADDR